MFSKVFFNRLLQLNNYSVYCNCLLKRRQLIETSFPIYRCLNSSSEVTDNQLSEKFKTFIDKSISRNQSRNLLQEIDLNDKEFIDLFGFREINALDTKPDNELLDEISPTLGPSFNLSAFANKSVTLQMLIKLGVDLSVIEKKSPETAEHILKLDFEADVKPYIRFLVDKGVKPEDLGYILTRNPYIFGQHLDDLEIRVKYLESKKFTKQMISSVITKGPKFLNYSIKTIDYSLGLIQKHFQLSADQLRALITNYPRIALLPVFAFQKLTFIFEEEFGFNKIEIKEMLSKSPMIFRKLMTDKKQHRIAVKIFDLIHNEMKIPHELIARHPMIFHRRYLYIEWRHLYLKKLGRDQYEPKQPLYVPLSAFYLLEDNEFCEKYAKTSVNDFNMFLKSI